MIIEHNVCVCVFVYIVIVRVCARSVRACTHNTLLNTSHSISMKCTHANYEAPGLNAANRMLSDAGSSQLTDVVSECFYMCCCPCVCPSACMRGVLCVWWPFFLRQLPEKRSPACSRAFDDDAHAIAMCALLANGSSSSRRRRQRLAAAGGRIRNI